MKAVPFREREPIANPSGTSQHRSKRRHSANPARGKLLLVTIFCVLRGVDLLLYFGISGGDKPRLNGAIIVGAIWTTALLVALWRHQNWARYFLISLVLLEAFAYLLLAPDFAEIKGTSSPVLPILIISGIAHGCVVWCLVRSRSIWRLSQRASV